ncbi:MAG TPA: alpha/beta fold hydrolase [Mycobacteriales bacterium]
MRDTYRPGTGLERLRLVTEDGVRLSGLHLPGRPGAVGDQDGKPDLAFVVAHGFTCSIRRPVFRAICDRLSAFGAVVACDFRGHGDSGGRSTVGAEEVLDVRAAVRWARERYPRVATVGFSMGGSVVLRHAALYRGGDGVDAVASISAPSRWYVLDTPPMRRVHWLCETALGRATARLMGTRLAGSWQRPPASPVELVDRIPPIPLLLVHGDRDGYFTLEHPRALAAAAGAGTELWVEPGFGHAESAATPDLLDRIGGWLASSARHGASGTILL